MTDSNSSLSPASLPPCRIIVFAKAPLPGYAKTRLAKRIGNQAAARLARRMLEHAVGEAVTAKLGPVEICCSPDSSDAAFAALRQTYPKLILTEQGEGDLGQRMQRAFARCLANGERVIITGTDAPALNANVLRHAAQALNSAPAVFAPTFDGGYALIGLSQMIPAVFSDISWSTEHVMQQTRAKLALENLTAIELAKLNDIDEAEDLIHLPPNWLTEAQLEELPG